MAITVHEIASLREVPVAQSVEKKPRILVLFLKPH